MTLPAKPAIEGRAPCPPSTSLDLPSLPGSDVLDVARLVDDPELADRLEGA